MVPNKDYWDKKPKELTSYYSKEILSVPDFDTSKQIRKALKKIKQNNPKLIEKLLSDNNDYKELKDELFSSGKNLKDL